MTETEGVIKYQLHHRDEPLSANISTVEINAWRHILFRLNLIGQKDDRYHGYGYGNISERLDNERFLVSGTQTGHLPTLESQNFAVVEHAFPESNTLVSFGKCSPSSEALTHAILYQQNKVIGAVIHVHCPELWHNTKRLNIPFTEKEIPYGSVDMVFAVKNLLLENNFGQSGIFSMLGHEDGIVTFGKDLTQAATLLIAKLSQALALELAPRSR